jgi:hypothetical protein
VSRQRPLEHGDARHLPWGCIRWSIARQMRLLVEMAGGSAQYTALLAGVDVLLTREQVAGFVPPARQPANLDDHAVWILRGSDSLEPA